MTIKEFIGNKVEYDPECQWIWGVTNNDEQQHILTVRGWGAIQNAFSSQKEAAAFQDSLGRWFQDAINEKIEIENVVE